MMSVSDRRIFVYTDIRTNEPSVRNEQITFKYRRDVLILGAEKEKKDLCQINHDSENLRNALQNEIGSEILIRRLFRKLEENERSAQYETSQRITNKLNKVYRGTVKLPEKAVPFLNLSDKI